MLTKWVKKIKAITRLENYQEFNQSVKYTYMVHVKIETRMYKKKKEERI